MKMIDKQKIQTIMIDVISALFILLFVYAAVSKLKDFEKFEVQLGKSPIVNPFVTQIAWVVPIFEIGILALLVIKRFQFVGLCAAFILMVMFSAYIIAILKFSSYIPCSCGGILQNMSWTQHLYFNIMFIVLGAIGILIYPNTDKDLIGHKRESLNPVREGII
jgi:uncharacterized membrane protein YphA (DoxX/SURF4 family)